MLITISKENYLKAIAEAQAEGKTVIPALLAHLLSEIFGMGWVEVHDEAERLEHAVSPAFEKKLVKMLGHGGICPHGNALAIMNTEQRRKKGQCLLSEAETGSRYRVCSVYERDRKLLEFLQERGIRPGTRLKVESQNYDGTAILKVERNRIALGSPVAERIWVAPEHQRNLH